MFQVSTGDAITTIGLMFGALLIFLILILLMVYFYTNKRYFLPILVVFLFSLIVGMISFEFGLPFTPYIQIFFIIIQAVFFLMTAFQVLKG